jgi:hypothetical protein
MNKKRKQFVITSFLIATFSCGCESKPSEQIEISSYFSLYSGSEHGINLNELHNPDNNQILNACLDGAAYSELSKFSNNNLAERLKLLQKGKIIKQIRERYYLNFPVILGEKRTKLQKLVEKTALQLLPETERVIKEIKLHLKGHEEMLYHIVWSGIMDGGVVWSTLRKELQERVKKGDTKIENTAWIIYPRHPYHCGTNGYGDAIAQTIITWSSVTPPANFVYKAIKPYRGELIHSSLTKQPIENTEVKNVLAEYGLVDDEGIATAHIFNIDLEAETFQKSFELGSEFGHEVMKQLDVEKVANMLDISQGQALVIVYHEVCYEIFKQLASRSILHIPDIVIKPRVETSQMHDLITFVYKSDERQKSE